MGTSKRRISTRVRGSLTTHNANGTSSTKRSLLGPMQIARTHDDTVVRRRAVYAASSIAEREILRSIHSKDATMAVDMDGGGFSGDGMGDNEDDWIDMPSHEGGEVEASARLTEEIYILTGERRRIDSRDRRDRVHQRNLTWDRQRSFLINAYLEWDCNGSPEEPVGEDVPRHASLPVIDFFKRYYICLPRHPEESLVHTLARHDYLAAAPEHPTTAFSFDSLRSFMVLSTRCPQLSAQAFVKSMCELQGVLYQSRFREQFTIAFDEYVAICAAVNERVTKALGRNEPDWRLKNACPACTYTLEEEPPLKFSMQFTMDGNNSQKRVERVCRETNDAGAVVSSTNIERQDDRVVFGDYYLSPEEVDKFKNKVKRRSHPEIVTPEEAAQQSPLSQVTDGRPIDGVSEPTPCTDKWANLSDEAVKKMWGIFRETGIFLAVCRHGNILLMCDMIKSGELAKYPIAIVHKLVSVFGHDLISGYDIGCGFSTTANNSPLLGEQVHEHRLRFCVGSFHGHAHCRLCQLDWHPLYIEGAGLEDFEKCEQVFSDSNRTAMRTRYASRFHCQQILSLHFQRWDKDKYQALGRYLLDNYRQSVGNISVLTEQLAATKLSLNINSDSRFLEWHRLEKEYLRSLKKEPESDILKVKYLQTLIKLRDAEAEWARISDIWQVTPIEQLEDPRYYIDNERQTRHIETARRGGLDSLLTLQKAIRDLETKREIQVTWTPDCAEWKAMETYLHMRTYQQCLDTLEGLVVARLFELTKMNQSQTGYKLRTHIAKALKARSEAIRTAIKKYNEAAQQLRPSRPVLNAKSVLDYVFLAEFDLLQDTRNDVREQPWAQPAERLASNTYFTLCRSHKEKLRVEIEAHRLRTLIHYEEQHFETVITKITSSDPLIAHQVRRVYQERRLVNDDHNRMLTKLEGLPGYAGTRGIGVSKGAPRDTNAGMPTVVSSEGEMDIDHEDDGEPGDQDALIDALMATFAALDTT